MTTKSTKMKKDNSDLADVIAEIEDLERLVSEPTVEIDNGVESTFYKVTDHPPPMVTVMSALQHIVVSFTGAVSTAYVVADAACIPYDSPLRSQLFCTTIFMVGLCTILQTMLGVRLPIFQGASASFLVPLRALQRDPIWTCSPETLPTNDHSVPYNSSLFANDNMTVPPMKSEENPGTSEAGQLWRLQNMSGALILASTIEVLLGLFGGLNILLRFIGPITVGVTIALIGTSLADIPLEWGHHSFGLAFGCMALTLVFILYLKDISIPLPKFGKRNLRKEGAKNEPRQRFYIFQLLPILLGVLIMWIICAIMTSAGFFSDDRNHYSYLARADAKLDIIKTSPWLQLTYPGQFGAPKLHVALTVGFLVAFVSSVMESVGDYYAAQVVCGVPRPPKHAITRGILVEGIGSVLSGFVGAGHATTSYSTNIAILMLSRTTSRMVMYAAGFMLIALSVLGKAGAAFTAIPNPILGGTMMVMIGTLISIGLASMRNVDMTSTRNLLVVGVPIMAGIAMPVALTKYPENLSTGNLEADRILKVVLGTPMFFGGFLAMVLDNTVPGSPESRGIITKDHDQAEVVGQRETIDVYSWTIYPRILKIFPFLSYLPFMPDKPAQRRCSKTSAALVSETSLNV